MALIADLGVVLARAGDGAFAVGADGRIASWNRAAERILGYPAREVLGKSCCDVFVGHDDDGNRLCYQGCHVMTLLAMRETIQSFDMRTNTKAGRPVWLNVSILPLDGGSGAGGTSVHLFRDVTATRELLTLVHEKLAGASGDGTEATPPLTRRELEILRHLAAGSSTKTMAEKLNVSTATVRNHVRNLSAKLGVHSRLAAVAYATRHRLL